MSNVDTLQDKVKEASSPAQLEMQAEQDEQIRHFKPLLQKWWVQAVVWAVSIALAAWNAILFLTVIPGWMGRITALMAICVEGTALWCVFNYPRGVDSHKTWMGRIAIGLGCFSLLHAIFSVVHFTGYGSGWWFVEFYSNVLAMPIIVVLLSVSTAILTMTDPESKVLAALSKVRHQTMINRADLMVNKEHMAANAELQAMKAKMFEIENTIAEVLIPLIEERGEIRERTNGIIAGISDSRVRAELQEALDDLKGQSLLTSGSSNGLLNP
jgi:hypothetical protein